MFSQMEKEGTWWNKLINYLIITTAKRFPGRSYVFNMRENSQGCFFYFLGSFLHQKLYNVYISMHLLLTSIQLPMFLQYSAEVRSKCTSVFKKAPCAISFVWLASCHQATSIFCMPVSGIKCKVSLANKAFCIAEKKRGYCGFFGLISLPTSQQSRKGLGTEKCVFVDFVYKLIVNFHKRLSVSASDSSSQCSVRTHFSSLTSVGSQWKSHKCWVGKCWASPDATDWSPSRCGPEGTVWKWTHHFLAPNGLWDSFPRSEEISPVHLDHVWLHILYSCEAVFSTMDIIKTKYCSRLTEGHLHMCMTMALTPFQPRFKILAGKAWARFSQWTTESILISQYK